MSDLSVLRANASLLLSFAPGSTRFSRALKQPDAAQRERLFSILRRNANCAYGRAHGLARVQSVGDFQAALPVATYEDLRPWVERILGGEDNVLTSDPVRLVERTSGSTTAAKYIPYTAGLFAEFQAALAPWLWNLYTTHPGLLRGTAYWQVTPLARAPERTRGGIPIGLGAEASYFTALQQRALARVVSVPAEIAGVADIESNLYVTLFFLLRDRNLSLISVWNPSFFSILLKHAREWSGHLVRDIHDGEIRRVHLPPTIARKQLASPQRARAVANCLSEARIRMTDLWPRLSVVSGWGDAEAAPEFQELEREFPDVAFQRKGLLATEGVITIPRAGVGNVAAIRSHFLEFLDDHGRPHMVHEVEQGAEYSVVMTTSGGLWRYRLGDRVRVTGFLHRAPLLEFVGKEDGVCDLRGEKLNPAFVGSILRELRRELLLPVGFAMLAPSRTPEAGYLLLVEHGAPEALATALDNRLRTNPHYAYARELGQLAAPRVVNCGANSAERYMERCIVLGQRAGDVKPTSLHRAEGWEDWFLAPSQASLDRMRA
jgi:hypothetical protein